MLVRVANWEDPDQTASSEAEIHDTHTCHTSHCEIKSQNLGLLKADPIRFSNLTEFSDHLKHILYRNNHKSHFIEFITSFLH